MQRAYIYVVYIVHNNLTSHPVINLLKKILIMHLVLTKQEPVQQARF